MKITVLVSKTLNGKTYIVGGVQKSKDWNLNEQKVANKMGVSKKR